MKFGMFAASVPGKKYLERGLSCQDSSSTLEFDGVQTIAVADGHGGKDYFRSDTGSKLAVATVFKQVKIFCNELAETERFSENGIKNFELSIWEEWLAAVKNHWRENPIGDETRWQTVSDKYKARYTSTDENVLARYIPVAYGTTLLCAVSIGSQVLIEQIGDGSCVVLQRNGEFKVPVPPDEENFANVTTSLCDADAYKKFRHVVLNCAEDSPLAPVAIFLSTDGLDDCYPIYENEKYLFKLYGDAILDGMISNGFAATRDELREELLPYMTEHGSNDDISLAYLIVEDLNLLKRALGKDFNAPAEDLKKLIANIRLNAEQLKKITEDNQPQVAKQAAQVREKLLTSLREERNENHG